MMDGKSKIIIKVLSHDDFIRELVLLVHEKYGFFAIGMTGKIGPHSIADEITERNEQKKVKHWPFIFILSTLN